MTEKVNEIGKTAGEQGSEQWLKERRNRLTASNFGSVCRIRNTTSPKNTVQNLLYSTFKGNAATAYGLTQETETERQLVAWTVSRGASEVSVSHPGPVLLPGHNVLGASPDGIVVCKPKHRNMPSQFIVEYKNREKLNDLNLADQEAVGLIKEFPLRKVDENFALKKSHPIYNQEQGVMAATGISEAAFVNRGAKSSMEVLWVPFDTEFFYTMSTKTFGVLF